MKTKLMIPMMVCMAVLVATAGQLQAGTILHLTETMGRGTQAGIPGILTADGHSVTTVTDSGGFASIAAALNGNLAPYDLLVLDLSDYGGGTATELASIENFRAAGGRVFFTGVDSARNTGSLWGGLIQSMIGNPSGSTTDIATSTSPGPVANIANSLTTGVVDIRGQSPGSFIFADFDRLDGPLASDTVSVLPVSGGSIWTLRTPISGGEVAYLSSPYQDYSLDPVYSGALRNFASFNSVPEPASFGIFGTICLIGCGRRRKS